MATTTDAQVIPEHESSTEPQNLKGQGFSPAVDGSPRKPRGHDSHKEQTSSNRAPSFVRGWHRINALARSRAVQMVLVFTIALVTIGAGDTSGRFSNIGHKMVCACSCGQILLECNHVGCPDSDRMIRELRAQVAAGGTDTSIFNWFVAKYGPTVLAAPIRGGFDNAAWIVPVVVAFLAIFGTVFLIRRWKGRHMLAIAGAPAITLTPNSDAMRDRIRRETEF